MPKLARPATPQADPTPLFVLRQVSIVGATAISRDRLATAFQPYVGRKVSQADLAAIAAGMSDIYRTAGFHLSRAIVPPQDINDGSIRVQVIEGSITALDLKGEGAEEFGVRQILNPVLAEQPSQLTTLERGLLPPDRLRQDLAHLYLLRPRQSRLIRCWPMAKLCDRGIQLLPGSGRHAGGQSFDHARRPA
jgi:hemolysin activation/secretion protein